MPPLNKTYAYNWIHQGFNRHLEVGFTPVANVTKAFVVFLGPFWCNEVVDPKRYVYELLVRNIGHKINDDIKMNIN